MNEATKPLEEVEPVADPVGRVVGRFVLLQRLGEGGSAEVFAAFDPVLDRRVAIKILHGRRPAEAAVIREGRILARLAHPGVVAVHDVGIHAGRAFLAMELVTGGDLGAWLAASPGRRSLDVLRALVHAGGGLAAAHAAGVVHGDIKPANLLVGDDGLARVSDFGIARAGEPRAATDGSAHGIGAGTPLYMAPEQHAGSAADRASDQYAFCLTAWVALSGRHPYAGDESSAEHARHTTARGRGDGSATPDTGQDLGRAQAQWHPRWRGPVLPAGVARALEKGLARDPAARFATMDDLLRELTRGAAPRRSWLGGLALVTLVGAAGLGGTWMTAQAPEPCRGADAQMAEVWNAARAQAIAAVMADAASFGRDAWGAVEPTIVAHARAWTRMHTEACEATAVRAEQSARVLDLRMRCLRHARTELDAALRTLETADVEVARNAHRVIESLRPIDRCADGEAGASGLALPEDAAAAGRVEAVRASLLQARAELVAGRAQSAEASMQGMLPEVEALAYAPLTAEFGLEQAALHREQGRYAEAEASLRTALALALRHDRFDLATRAAIGLADVVGHIQQRIGEGRAFAELALGLAERPGADPDLDAAAVDAMGMVVQRTGDYAAAESHYRDALARHSADGRGEDPRVDVMRTNLAGVLREQARFAEAQAELEVALASQVTRLGDRHPDAIDTRCAIARLAAQAGRLDDADAMLSRCVDERSAALGEGHPTVGTALCALADVRTQQGHHAEAETLLRRAETILTAALGPDHGDVGVVHNSLAIALMQARRPVEAEIEIRRAIAIQSVVLGAEHPGLATVHDTLGAVLSAQGRLDEAEAEHRGALDLRRAAFGEEHPAVITSHHNLGALLLRRGRPEAALAELQAALAGAEVTYGTTGPFIATELQGIGAALSELERPADARDVLERAWAIRDDPRTAPELRGATAWLLSQQLWALEERERAQTLAEIAEAAYRAAEGEAWTARIEMIATWRAKHRGA